jgi:hypothetical protein
VRKLEADSCNKQKAPGRGLTSLIEQSSINRIGERKVLLTLEQGLGRLPSLLLSSSLFLRPHFVRFPARDAE